MRVYNGLVSELLVIIKCEFLEENSLLVTFAWYISKRFLC